MNPDIVFVGAGPAGLYTAINAKLQNPNSTIVMHERNPVYTRNHILFIEEASYKDAHPDPRLQAIIKNLKGAVPTNEIEGKFRALALELGIEIVNERVTDVASLQKRYPTAHTIVGADGAKSTVRQQIFNDEKSIEKNLQYIIEVKYKTQNKTSALNPYNTFEGLANISHFVREHVGKPKPEGTPVSLFFFVDQKTYEEVYARGASGLKLSDIGAGSSEMTELANSILPWLALRKYHKDDRIIVGSDKIAGVKLDIYRSKYAVKEVDGLRYVLIGDARLGVPYFQALNVGLRGAAKAAQLMSNNTEYSNEQYEADMNALSEKAIANAYKKNAHVKFGKGAAFYSRVAGIKLVNPFMPQSATDAMERARVKPLPFHRRHRFFVTSLILFLIFATAMALALHFFTIPLLSMLIPALSLYVSKIGAIALLSSVVSLLLTATIGLVYKGIALCVSAYRQKPASSVNYDDFFTEEEVSNEQSTKKEVEKEPVVREARSASFDFFNRTESSSPASALFKRSQSVPDMTDTMPNDETSPTYS